MAESLGEFKQKIRKFFLLSLECLLLFLVVICGPIWANWPTGFVVADFVLWSLWFFLLIWGTYTAIRKVRNRKFGTIAEPPRFWDVLFYLLTILLGLFFISLAFFMKGWHSLLTPVALGLIGVVTVSMCGWELYKVGNRL